MNRKDRRDTIHFILKIYAREFQKHWIAFSLFLTVLVLNAAMAIIGPYVFSSLVDDLPKDLIPWILGFGLYALTAGLMRAFDAVIHGLSVVHAERLEFQVSTTFFSDVARKTPSFFVDYNPAEIQSAMSNGSGAVGSSFYIVFTYLLPALLSVVFGVALIGAAINMSLVLIVLGYGIIYVAIVLIAMEKTNRYLDEGIDAAQQNAAFTGNAVAMIEPIRHAGSTHWMDKRFSDKANDIFESFRAFAQRQIAFGSITALALFAQILIAYWVIYPQYQSDTMTVGGVVLFNMLLLQMNAPFEAIGQGISEFQRCFSRFLPYLEILREPNEHDLVQSNAAISQAVPNQISLKGVSFIYQNGRGVRDLSLVARKGTMTFITGETGTGKSTVFRLLQKTIDPQQGEINIGNIRLSDISKADWFSCIGIVPQEIQMLNDSVRTNIVLGRELDEERLVKACQRAAIFERICAMPEGFETKLGERGLKLSGGERQRIAIARALYNDPVILLLDEASSALDEETERLIMDQLRGVADQLIIIAITHRLSSIQPGDQVVELGKENTKA